MKYILTILILLYFYRSMSQSYTIIRVTELLKMEANKNGKFLFQDENTRATVYSIDGGKYTLSPASGPLGLLIDNKEALYSILSTRIPIERENPSPFELYIADIKSLNVSKLVNELFEKLKLKMDADSLTKEDYKLIEKTIKNYPKNKRYHDLLVPLGFFIGENILKKIPGKWELYKEYGYNPYFIPLIKNANLEIDPFYKLTQKILGLEGRKLDLLECIEKPFTAEGH